MGGSGWMERWRNGKKTSRSAGRGLISSTVNAGRAKRGSSALEAPTPFPSAPLLSTHRESLKGAFEFSVNEIVDSQVMAPGFLQSDNWICNLHMSRNGRLSGFRDLMQKFIQVVRHRIVEEKNRERAARFTFDPQKCLKVEIDTRNADTPPPGFKYIAVTIGGILSWF
uniref:Uncharacterized protein n=1 Tax=Chromera velia CCMP2878 TaxID=1169474 RepID=A0A0G4HPJ8_9ALVE|eukprot:Cvel_1235.t1-p1 / transcript=Cvel_1235.t1 / gene=Cvel_1235 / organism=Chromera_velia_CCMP2878 / gene_product=hypothetical protein / transcript_product=hypothetical protein / location=Cvel_scaffold41:72889-73800(-) / protein_length=167 / sequence_SO=supercontig / SO=protein_coding / is_pseudo=false